MQNGTESVLLLSIHLDAPDLLESLSHSQPLFFRRSSDQREADWWNRPSISCSAMVFDPPLSKSRNFYREGSCSGEYKRLRAELGGENRAIQTDLTASPLPNSSNYQMGSISEPERYQNHNLAVSANLRGKSKLMSREGEVGVTDGTRTRNSQNHNLGLYH